jgi:hypothetical protein
MVVRDIFGSIGGVQGVMICSSISPQEVKGKIVVPIEIVNNAI